MDPEIAAYWDVWSVQFGQAILPRLRELSTRLLGLTSAMVCTSDGFNLCSIGLDEAQVARLAALASSLYSVSGAASQVAQSGTGGVDILDMVSLHQGPSQTVIISVSGLITGNLLLWVTAESETLGVMLIEARAAAKQLHTLLAVDP
jgi:predicted regulator of Ras-like GTPase activity (Roadblock/LC7/MglB family)